MFKKISLLLVLVLVIGALSACASGGLVLSELTEAKKAELERAWAEKNYPINWNAEEGEPCSVQYYGTFEGYEVFLWCAPDIQEGRIADSTISGIPFNSRNTKAEFATCKDGVFTPLGTLSVMEGISLASVVQISQAYANHVSLPVSGETKKIIEEAWYGGRKWAWASESNMYGCRYYGTFHGYDLIYYQGEVALDAITEYEIAGVSFVSGSKFQLYAYRDGTRYELLELFKRGKISKEAIADAAEIHREWFPTFYE